MASGGLFYITYFWLGWLSTSLVISVHHINNLSTEWTTIPRTNLHQGLICYTNFGPFTVSSNFFTRICGKKAGYRRTAQLDRAIYLYDVRSAIMVRDQHKKWQHQEECPISQKTEQCCYLQINQSRNQGDSDPQPNVKRMCCQLCHLARLVQQCIA